MKYISLAFFLLFLYQVKAQDYHPFVVEGSEWAQVRVFNNTLPAIYDTVTKHYKITGDTLIADITYSKLYLCTDSIFTLDSPNTIYVGGLIEEDKIVKFINPVSTESGILYRFDTQIGDTLGHFVFMDSSVDYIVAEFDSILLLDNTYRKRQKIEIVVSTFDGNEFLYGWYSHTEGLGNLSGIFTRPCVFSTNCIRDQTLCYSQNGELLYAPLEIDGCHIEGVFSATDDIPTTVKKIDLFPNPAHTEIQIQLPLLEKQVQIAVYNSVGALQVQQITKPIPHQAIIIDISTFSSGIYFLEVKGQSYRWSEKFIKL